MKTKIILHGGYASHKNEQNDQFFKEILSTTKKVVNILLVYFAKESERVEVNREEDIFMFNKNNENKTLNFEVATEHFFVDQVKRADIVYLHGGTTLKILNTLKDFPNLKSMFEGKVIAGESAGSYVLSSLFYSVKAGGIFEGLGFVPVKMICHFSNEKKDKFEGLKDRNELESLFLSDYEYKVFHI